MSRIQSVKLAMGWQPLNKRLACANCRHVEERLTVGISTWHCRSGHFLTNAMAICNRHTGAANAPAVLPGLPAGRP